MPGETKTPKAGFRAVTRIVDELADLGGLIGGGAVLLNKFKTTFPSAAEKLEKAVTTDQRGGLLENITGMKPEDTENIRKWHKEAIADHTENRFVSLLCKIPRDDNVEPIKRTKKKQPKKRGYNRTQKVLAKLNSMDKVEFDQMLNLLEHDVIPQKIAWAWDKLHAAAKNIDKSLEPVADWLERKAGIQR